MDTFPSLVRRLIFFLVGCFVAFAAVSMQPVFAQSNYPSYQTEYELCAKQIPSGTIDSCQNSVQGSALCFVQGIKNGNVVEAYEYNCADEPSPVGCTVNQSGGTGTFSASSRSEANQGLICDTTDYNGPAVGSGCVESFVAGTGVANAAGGYVFSGSFAETGATCSPGADGAFTVTGASAPTPAPAPYAADSTPAQKSCDGGSCVDPVTGQACIVDQSGSQFCTPANAAFPPAPSNCYTDGSSATLCVGSAPPLPPSPPVTNPAAQIVSSDSYQYSTSASSGSTVVNVYNTSTGTTSSGQVSGDVGPVLGGAPISSSPAHASSAGGNGTLSGGTNCTSPPVCTGDSVLCGIARTQWATTCQLHTDIAGPTGVGPVDYASDLAANSDPSQIFVTPTVGNTVGDAANSGVYDASGGGVTQPCPLKDFTFQSVAGLTVHLSNGCTPLNWLALAGEGMALFAAAMITAGSNR